jgi:hypothetical protein
MFETPHEKHAISTNELRSALRLTVEFFEHLLLPVTDLSFKNEY